MTPLHLHFGLTFPELYSHDGLSKLDSLFVADLAETDVELHNRFVCARADKSALAEKEESEILVALAPYLEDFIAQLFGIEKDVTALASRHHNLAPLYSCKRLFIQRRAIKAYKPADAATFDGLHLQRDLETFFTRPFSEQAYAEHVTNWLEEEESHQKQLDIAARYAAWALYTEEGQHKHQQGIIFKTPKKLDFANLVPVETILQDGVAVMKLPHHHLRRREGFALTDAGADLELALDNANYCIWCHKQGKDSCSKGLKEKDGSYKKSASDVALAGCPLEEKISEMNIIKSEGYSIGALGIITVDNPMAAATGHRICNDCMKACIYQKQQPVDIPQVETRTLRDVLALPWGFEIYSLLTRWNPLNLTRPIPKKESGYKVLVSGLGPAGFTLSHHLLNEGHTVVAVDGLKIEPLPEQLNGVTPLGARVPFTPIRRIEDIFESLDERVLAGFGGVAEYGITVRWNKNYLKLVRLLLERRSHFSLFGGVRFGSTLTYESTFKLGFDHIALAMGAGKPTVISMPNGLARGVRTASDFLMALQLTGAAKKNSIANLQLRLPVVVIGGGLTAIDTATESLAYYPLQVEKFLSRHELLVKLRGEEAVRKNWSEEETLIAEEFIAHAKAIREERIHAMQQGREPDILSLINSWGGVKLAYRRTLQDAPSYRLNHEEVELAMQEGIGFVENITPVAVEVDQFGYASALKAKCGEEDVTIPARAILMAAGTSPNTVLQREDPLHFELDGKYFKAIDDEGNQVSPERISKPNHVHVLMSLDTHGKAVSFFGDLHPSFAGNVVKAMGSAKQGYPVVSRILSKTAPATTLSSAAFIAETNRLLRPTVHKIVRLTSNIIEVILKAPLAAEEFKPGQFYRLQNYEYFAHKTPHTTLAMEGLALTGAWVDREQGLLSTIVLEMGGSADLCAHLKPGEPVVLMGPTGTPTHTPSGETVMLVGGGLGNAVLFSIGKALKEAGSKVLYFAGYKKASDRYKVKEIEEASDTIIWCCDESAFSPERPQDKSFHGNIVQGITAYAEGTLGHGDIALTDVNRIIAIGSDRMMAAVAASRHGVLRPYLNPKHEAIGSINSPMQCMMKEICAQCLQKHVDPVTGAETYVYSCFNQDQCLDRVDFPHLNERLKQNGVQEKLTAQWIDHCLKEIGERI